MEFQGDTMKIAQVTAIFPPYMTGTGNVCYYNSLELAKLGMRSQFLQVISQWEIKCLDV